jgi:hypothetical protein
MRMAIPESQLETWSHQGAVTTSKNTYAAIRNALMDSHAAFAGKQFEVFLQGSYGNDTNIRADSDVDIVLRLDSIFRSDVSKLSADQQAAYQGAFANSTYTLAAFKQDVISHLQAWFGHHLVQIGGKAVRVLANSNRVGADVIICHEYRDYRRFISANDQSYDSGIIFSANGQEIINYPTLHRDNCVAKNKATNGWFKPTVRLFKNMRGRLIDGRAIASDTAPSYFVESMLYNVPDAKFGGSFCDTFCACVNWLRGDADQAKLVCANYKHWLFGSSSVQWSQDNCRRYLDALVTLWNGW